MRQDDVQKYYQNVVNAMKKRNLRAVRLPQVDGIWHFNGSMYMNECICCCS